MSDNTGAVWDTRVEFVQVLRNSRGFGQEMDLSVPRHCFCRDLGQAMAVFGFNLPSSLPSPAAVRLWDGDLSLMALSGLVWALSSWAIL